MYARGGRCSSHGTHCAGSVASASYGVAKDAHVVAVGALDCAGDGTTSTIIRALEWVVSDVQQRGARGVASLSLGGGTSALEDAAIAATHTQGIPVVVAAGNEGDDACNYSPSRAPSAITVGAITSSYGFASTYSNYGACVDIHAPGSSVLSLGASSDFALASMSGTSMATPHVAGAVAQSACERSHVEHSHDALSRLLSRPRS